MTFSMSLPVVLRSTISQNTLVVLYTSLLGLEMTTDIASLKCLGQCSRNIHVLAILIIFLRHVLSAMIFLRCLQEI